MQRKLPSPGFQVEVVLIDYDGTVPPKPQARTTAKESGSSAGSGPVSTDEETAAPNPNKDSGREDKDDVFSDSETDETGSSKSRHARLASASGGAEKTANPPGAEPASGSNQITSLTHKTERMMMEPNHGPTPPPAAAVTDPKGDAIGGAATDFKAMAADASVFTFGDDEDFESE